MCLQWWVQLVRVGRGRVAWRTSRMISWTIIAWISAMVRQVRRFWLERADRYPYRTGESCWFILHRCMTGLRLGVGFCFQTFSSNSIYDAIRWSVVEFPRRSIFVVACALGGILTSKLVKKRCVQHDYCFMRDSSVLRCVLDHGTTVRRWFVGSSS